MSAGQPIGAPRGATQFDYDELDEEARQVHDIVSRWTAAGRDKSAEVPGPRGGAGMTALRVASARDYDLEIDQEDRLILAPRLSRGRRAVRRVLVIGVLVAASAVAWEHGSSWYRLAWETGSDLYRFLEPSTGSSSQPAPNPAPLVRGLDSKDEDRLQIDGTARGPTREADQKPMTDKAGNPEISPPETSTSKEPEAEQQPATPVNATTGEPQTQAIRTPWPETMPTTIPGWRLREVGDDTVVLEGPNGVVRAKQGDSVPSLGKVYSVVHWGNHLLVATSKGLIGTR